ncbi:MAG: hypothetical protein R3F48_06930 [Candidatus Zixiibacteriota bacterium]
MKKVTVLLAMILIFAVACDKNDDNTVNPIPKSHKAYPVFHMIVDNDYQTFGVDSVQLTVTPDIGWLESVFTDANGYIGTQAAGTYITDIDTIVDGTDTTFDTTSINFGFTPGQEYTFSFQRGNTYTWADEFKIEYGMVKESTWTLLSADTVRVTKTPDPVNTLYRHPDSVKIYATAFDTLTPKFDSLVYVERMLVTWFDTVRVVTNPDDTLILPPEAVDFDTVRWVFYSRTDTNYIAIDSATYCDIAIDTIIDGDDTTFNDFFVITRDTALSEYGSQFPLTRVDTVVKYINCTGAITQQQTKIYRHKGWGNYTSRVLTTLPDTVKELYVNNGVLTIRNTETGDTRPASIYLVQDGMVTEVTNLVFNLTMPEVEVYPDYQIIIKDE